jgi:hypothetical protein
MKEKISESSTVGYCGSDYASTSTLTTVNGYWGGISTTDNATIISDGTTAVRNLLPDLNSTKKKVVEGIMDGVMELDSLVDNGATETYEITEITFKERKTRFTCRKEVDLEYAGGLKRRTELLLEFTPIQVDDHKKRAIEHSEGSVLVSGTGIVTTTTGNPLTWTYVPGNVTYGTNAITISADGFSTTGNINYA